MAFTLVTVTADYDLPNGLDPVGTVEFTPSEPMVNGTTVAAAPVVGRLDIDGILRIELAANTDPGTTTPSGRAAYYRVRESISGVIRDYAVTIRHDQGSVFDLASYAP